MAYDERLAERLRDVLEERTRFDERKMFGGLAFMVGGNMCCGIVGEDLMVRVGPEGFDAALKRPHARVMDFTGRPSKGMVFVGPGGYRTGASLTAWVERGLGFVRTLPPKQSKR